MKIGKFFEYYGKNILEFLAKIFIKNEQLSPSDINPNKIKKVLIIRQDRKVGNMILSTPLFECTHHLLPEAMIDIIVAKNLKVLCDDIPYLNSSYVFEHKTFIKNPIKFFRLIHKLRKKNYDLVIDSSNPSGSSFLNGLLTYITKAPIRIGFAAGKGSIFDNVHITPDHSKHYYYKQQELINFLAKDKITFRPRIFSSEEDINTTRRYLFEKFNLEVDTRIIGLWIGARHNKKWNIKNFKTLYDRITSGTNYLPILVFGIEEAEGYNRFNKSNYRVIYFDDLKKLKSFISSCNIFTSGDTGPLHFSFALGVPTIGVFLQNNYVTYGYADSDNNFIVKPAETDKMIEEIIKSIKKIIA